MTRSPGFGSTACDYAPLSDSVSLRLPYTVKLATNSKSLTHYTKGTQSPTKGSCCLYAHGFRVYFTPFTRVLFAFPSRYWFTIGRSGVFSLGGWSPHVQTGFHVPRPTHFSSVRPFRILGCHRLRPPFPECFARTVRTFGLVPVRSSLLRESRLISFPPGT
jgi:hypothetical protein